MDSKASSTLPKTNRVAISENLAVLFCPASNGKTFAVTIDRGDLDRVIAAGPWSVANFGKNGSVRLYCYSRRRGPNGKTLYLHRLVMNAPADPAIEVDHIHNRSLDTRKSEMRLASKSLNQRNKRRCGPDNKFGQRGVIATRSGRFSARVWINNKSKILGTYGTPELAAERVRQFLQDSGAVYAAGSPTQERHTQQ